MPQTCDAHTQVPLRPLCLSCCKNTHLLKAATQGGLHHLKPSPPCWAAGLRNCPLAPIQALDLCLQSCTRTTSLYGSAFAWVLVMGCWSCSECCIGLDSPLEVLHWTLTVPCTVKINLSHPCPADFGLPGSCPAEFGVVGPCAAEFDLCVMIPWCHHDIEYCWFHLSLPCYMVSP